MQKRDVNVMLKTCSVCGKIHDYNKVCRRQTKNNNTKENKFRNTNKWIEKRKQIKIRDKNLCQICITGKYDTMYRYNYKQLEVHHIIPIKEDYSKRLDSSNLITLCRYHHELAESGQIPREELLKIVEANQ